METASKGCLSFSLSRGRCENLFSESFIRHPDDDIFRWVWWNLDFMNGIGCVGVNFFGKRIFVPLLWSKVKVIEVCYLVDFNCGVKLRILGTRETVNILVFEPDPMRRQRLLLSNGIEFVNSFPDGRSWFLQFWRLEWDSTKDIWIWEYEPMSYSAIEATDDW